MNAAVRKLLMQVGLALPILPFVLGVLFTLEGTGGHDGWLCEWGYDFDGAGGTTSGCG